MTVSIPHYGQTSSAPVYDALYTALESAGYTADRDLVVAGYDFRLTPDLGGFRARTKQLIEQTWRRNDHRPVRLVGHSNGPLYAQYLLTHVSAAVEADVHPGLHRHRRQPARPGRDLVLGLHRGRDPDRVLATDDPGHGAQQRAPDRPLSVDLDEHVRPRRVRPPGGGRQEPGDRPQLHAGRHRPAPSRRWAGLDQADRPALPRVCEVRRPRALPGCRRLGREGLGPGDARSESCCRISRLGQVVDQATADFINLPGDSNQEYITNDAVRVWHRMRCYRFRSRTTPASPTSG